MCDSDHCASAGTALFFGGGTGWTVQAYPPLRAYHGVGAQGVACWKPNHCIAAGDESGINPHGHSTFVPVFWKTG